MNKNISKVLKLKLEGLFESQALKSRKKIVSWLIILLAGLTESDFFFYLESKTSQTYMFWKNYGRVLMYDALPRLITIIIIVSVVQVTWRDKRSRWRLQIILLFVVGWRILLHARMGVIFFKWSWYFLFRKKYCIFYIKKHIRKCS